MSSNPLRFMVERATGVEGAFHFTEHEGAVRSKGRTLGHSIHWISFSVFHPLSPVRDGFLQILYIPELMGMERGDPDLEGEEYLVRA